MFYCKHVCSCDVFNKQRTYAHTYLLSAVFTLIFNEVLISFFIMEKLSKLVIAKNTDAYSRSECYY